jgi:predicted nucleic acid-binding protein
MAGEPRIALDTNILIRGMIARWGSPKAVLVLATRRRFRLVLSAAVEEEARRVLAAGLADESLLDATLRLCPVERTPFATEAQMDARLDLLTAVRHVNDFAVAVAVDLARPDLFVSDNTQHFGQAFAARTGIPVLTSGEFLDRILETALPSLFPPPP